MDLVDVHCHLENPHLHENLKSVLADARDAGIKNLITSSITPDQWETSLQLAGENKEIECTLGVHPWYLQNTFMRSLEGLEGFLSRGAVAVGETGLDKKIDSPGLEMQVEFFEKQLSIARDMNLPVVIHCRGAFGEVKRSIKRVGMPDAGGIIHSFSGSIEVAEDFIPLGMSFSLGGILTYRNSRKRGRLMQKIYPRHFLLETDSPDIPPIEVRTDEPVVNVPANILYNLRAAAEILQVSAEEVARHTTENASKLFNLDLA